MRKRASTKEKAQVKSEAAAELDRRYAKAREKYLKILSSKTAKDFYPTLSSGTLKRIEDGVDVDPINRERLIELMGGGVSNRVYRDIASRVGQSKSKRELAALLCGKYRYFRQDSPTTAGEAELAEGRIEIFKDRNGDIAFKHWSPELDDAADPEHTGYAFLADNKLFMLAWKPGVLRLGIAHCTEDCAGVMNGYVLSVRSVGGAHPIFSAPSVLVNETRSDELDKFRAEGAAKHFSRHHPGHLPDYQST